MGVTGRFLKFYVFCQMENRPIYSFSFWDLIFDQNVADSFMEFTRHSKIATILVNLSLIK